VLAAGDVGANAAAAAQAGKQRYSQCRIARHVTVTVRVAGCSLPPTHPIQVCPLSLFLWVGSTVLLNRSRQPAGVSGLCEDFVVLCQGDTPAGVLMFCEDIRVLRQPDKRAGVSGFCAVAGTRQPLGGELLPSPLFRQSRSTDGPLDNNPAIGQVVSNVPCRCTSGPL
jgi:hypothetical protein